ncbi:MAG: class I SAM-dependent methyltransferase [Oscillospiraceae bacterium]|jgi:tRNA (adenine22-N1)-methyltransferase|nr:class I SAM-dependent methyltransferase [Oscillospiraceae bacterium]
MKVRLDARLATCAALVRQGSSVADIGSDHALLPAFLWQNGWTDLIASDINERPLDSARRTLEKHGISDVKLILSDGFENLPPCDDVIIAGMGGEMIVEILSGCRHKGADTRFILQPMTRHEALRRELYRLGFEIITEVLTQCSKKIYTIIHACYTGEKRETDDVFAFVGKQKNPLYIEKQLSKIIKLAKGDSRYSALAAEIKELL